MTLDISSRQPLPQAASVPSNGRGGALENHTPNAKALKTAASSFLSRESTSISRNFDAISLDPPSDSEQEDEYDTESKPGVVARVTAYVGETRLGRKVLSNGWVCAGAKKLVIGTTDYSAKALRYLAEIDTLFHHNHFSCLLELLLPKLVTAIAENIHKQIPVAQGFVEKERQYLHNLITAILCKAIRNITRQAIEHYGKTSGGKIEHDVGIVVVEYLLGKVYHHFDSVDRNEFIHYYNHPDHKRREIKLRSLVHPLCEELLQVAFPKGRGDLGVGSWLAGIIWETVEKKTIPDLLIDAYRMTRAPMYATQEDKSALERPGGEFVKSLISIISNNCQNLGRTILVRNSDKLAEKLLCSLSGKLGWDPALYQWLSQILTGLGESESVGVNKLCTSFALNIHSILTHVFGALARFQFSGDPLSTNIIPTILQKTLSVIHNFLAHNSENVIIAMDRFAGHPDTQVAERELAKFFKPLAIELFDICQLGRDPLIGVLKDELFPLLLLDFFRDMYHYKATIIDDRHRLSRRIFDGQQILNLPQDRRNNNYEQLLSAIQNNVTGEEALWNLSGVTEAADALKGICGAIASDIRAITERYFKEHPERLAKNINELFDENLRLSEPHQQHLAEGVHEFVNDTNTESLKPILTYCQSLLETMLYRLFVAIAENTENATCEELGENCNSLIASSLTRKLFTLLCEHFPAIQIKLNSLNAQDLDEKARREQAIKIFAPFSTHLLQLAGETWTDTLPVPSLLKGLTQTLIEEKIMPTLIHNVYFQLYGWVARADSMETQLDERFQSMNATNAVRLIGQYVQNYIPFYFEINPERVVNIVESFGERYLEHMTPEHRDSLRSIMVRNIRFIGTDSTNVSTWKAAGVYAKSIVLKMFTGVSREIELNERVRGVKGESTFLLDTVVNIMNVAKDHFVEISNIPVAGRCSPAHRVSHHDLLVGFSKAKLLHPALYLDGAGTPKERKKERLKHFYRPLAKKLISIAGIENSEDFPIPENLRNDVWRLFENKIMPEILMSIFNDILGARNTNRLLLKTIDYLNSKIESIEDDHYIEDDQHQKDLNEACGDIIVSMVNLIPQIFTKTVIPADKLKEMTAEELGGLVRRKLQQTSMLELMDKLLEQTNLPNPQEETWKDPVALAKHDAQIEKELKQKMTMYISKQVKAKLKASMERKWDQFQKDFDRVIYKVLGQTGLSVKKFLDKVFHFIFFTVLGPLFNFVLFNVFWFFVDTVISRKAIELINDAQMPIHENLIFKVTEAWVDLMNLAKIKRQEALS